MKIAVLGGDGFVGWPTSLHPVGPRPRNPYSRQPVRSLDRYRTRRPVADADGLHPGAHAHLASGNRRRIHFHLIDLAARLRGSEALAFGQPARRDHPFRRAARRALFDEIVMAQALHRQQQPERHARRALRHRRDRASTSHLVHLGTMGVYGYGTAGTDDPRGLSDGEVGYGRRRARSSRRSSTRPIRARIYHMTKTQDQLLFQFYDKNDGVRITDLHQGIVWGTQTAGDAAGRAADQPLRL